MTRGDRPLAVTIGEPAGIGPDISGLAWADRARLALPPFAVIGDAAILAERAGRLGLDMPIVEVSRLADAPALFADALPVLPHPAGVAVEPGRPVAAASAMVLGAIERAVELALAGEAAGIVTNPIHKQALYEAGFDHPGHTEYLEALARRRGHAAHAVMMLTAHGLRTVPLTIHIPLKDVPAALDTAMICDKVRIVARDLARFFRIGRPRIAVTGLNPHAGEGGSIGREEGEVIAPAIERLIAEGFDVTGPLPADTVFHEEARAAFDVIVCMYHDQALIPVKMLGFHEGVNCTLGLPFVRTSPDHGTALALAGTGRANPSSFVTALGLAAEMAANI